MNDQQNTMIERLQEKGGRVVVVMPPTTERDSFLSLDRETIRYSLFILGEDIKSTVVLTDSYVFSNMDKLPTETKAKYRAYSLTRTASELGAMLYQKLFPEIHVAESAKKG